jgi:hypothetical protein
MENREKMATFFEDKKKERERQMKERKKLLDGSSSEESGDDKGGRDETQTGAYNSLTPLGTTTRTSPSQTKGNLEPEQTAIEVNRIELNNSNISHENSNTSHENLNTSQENTYSKRISTGELQGTSERSPVFCGLTGIPLVEFDFSSDSLGSIAHMPEESLESCFIVGNNDNQTNEEARPETRRTRRKSERGTGCKRC